MKNPEIIAEAPKIKIPQGNYTAVCYRADYKKTQFGKRLFLNFRITEGEYSNMESFMTIPITKNKYRKGTKLYEQWSLAIGRFPYKGEKFNTNVFVNKLYEVKVRNTNCRFSGGKLKPDFMQYSVVGTIIEALTGVPCDEN